MKKKKLNIIFIVFIICVTFVISISYENNYKNTFRTDTKDSYGNNIERSYVAASFKINPFDIDAVVEEVDYIFTGKVLEYLGSYYNEEEDLMVYSKYKVEVTKNIKGELIDEIIIKKHGGFIGNKLILLSEGNLTDELPEIGKEYLFNAYAQFSGDILIFELNGQLESSIKNISLYIKAYEKIKNRKIENDRVRANSRYEKK